MVAVPVTGARGDGGTMGASDRGLTAPVPKLGGTPRPDAVQHPRHSIAAQAKPRHPQSVGAGPLGSAPQRPNQGPGGAGVGYHAGTRDDLADAVRPSKSRTTFPRAKLQDALDHAKFSGAVVNGVDTPGPEYNVRPAVPPLRLSKVLEPRVGPAQLRRQAKRRIRRRHTVELQKARAAAPAGFTPRGAAPPLDVVPAATVVAQEREAARARRAANSRGSAAFLTSSPRHHFTVCVRACVCVVVRRCLLYHPVAHAFLGLIVPATARSGTCTGKARLPIRPSDRGPPNTHHTPTPRCTKPPTTTAPSSTKRKPPRGCA